MTIECLLPVVDAACKHLQQACVYAFLQETIRQQEWKIERLTKDNRALEASNCEIRAQLETIKEENLQVLIDLHLMQLLSASLFLFKAQPCCPESHDTACQQVNSLCNGDCLHRFA